MIVDAVLYLHEHIFANLDIKPENIFVDSDFCPAHEDFGHCKIDVAKKKEFLNQEEQFCTLHLKYWIKNQMIIII